MSQLPSLHRQLLGWLLLPILLVWVLGGVVSYVIAVRYADLANDRALFDSALTLAGQVRQAGDGIVLDQADTAVKMIAVDPYDKVFYKVSMPHAGLIAGMNELASPSDSELLPDKPYYDDGLIDGRHVRIASLLHSVGTMRDPVLIQVAETLVKRRVLASEILAGIVLPQLVLIILAAMLVRYGIGRGLVSLERVQFDVRNRSHLDLSPLRADNVPQEVEALVQAINDLMRQLGQVIAKQDRFIADAAHQLRTPLAGIKTQAELALRQTDPMLVTHSLQQLQTSSDRMIHLVNQLLMLARAEANDNPEKQEINLVKLVGEVTSLRVPDALKKSIDLGFETSVPVAPFIGNALLLMEMLGNLVNNAICYTQAGGEITVSIAIQENQWVVAVEDNGPGVPQEESELIFERFHRVAVSEEEGAGLGLPIAREIAHMHGGEVRLCERFPGARFEIHLPFHPPATSVSNA